MAATAQAGSRKKAPAKKRPSAGKKATARKAAASTKSSSGYDRGAWARKQAKQKSHPEQPLMKALRAEHRHMASVMQLFSDQLKAVEEGQLVDTHVVYEIMDYMITWPDRFHHPREDLIYGRAAEVDASVADNVDSLQRDHDNTAKTGRAVLKDIERWREGEVTGDVVVKSGRAYIDHLYEHMNTEEKVVFPQIENLLSLDDWRELAVDDELKPVADPVFGPRVQREFRNLSRKLRRNVRRGVERGTLVEWIGIEALMESMEVLSMAYDSARSVASDHVRAAVEDSKDILKESLLSAPFRCALNNTKLTVSLLGDVAEISRDTFDDLSRVNQERMDRIRLLDRQPRR